MDRVEVAAVPAAPAGSVKKLIADVVRTNAISPIEHCLKAVADDKEQLLKTASAVLLEVETIDSTACGSKFLNDVYDELTARVAHLDAESLSALCRNTVRVITDEIVSGRTLQLLPKLLGAVSRHDVDGFRRPLAFSKAQAIEVLVQHEWNRAFVVPAAAMFLDIPMSDDQLKAVIGMLVGTVAIVPEDELPALVYQLLLLATKGHKGLVVKGVVRAIANIDHQIAESMAFEESLESEASVRMSQVPATDDGGRLRAVKGTVLLHISYAAKQDQELGREVQKFVKAEVRLSPFALAVALSVANIHRFQDQVFDEIKGRVLSHYRDADRHGASSWINEAVGAWSTDGAIPETVMATLEDAASSWDQVTHGLVLLGATLMDSCKYDANQPLSPGHLACMLGSRILKKTFEICVDLRPEILDQVLSRVVTRATGSVEQYLELLCGITSLGQHVLVEHAAKVREAFDYVACLEHTVAVGLLRAVQPLVRGSSALRDALILVLRKALFNRDINARKVAASGLLMLMEDLPGGGARAQSARDGEALAIEICGMLRRCLTQQASIRTILYSGLQSFAARASPSLHKVALEMVQSQLARFLAAPDAVVPLRLDRCVPPDASRTGLYEPLGDLVECLWCLSRGGAGSRLQADDDGGVAAAAPADDSSSVRDGIVQLGRRVVAANFEDMELDKHTDFDAEDVLSGRNRVRAVVLHSILGNALNVALMAGTFSIDTCNAAVLAFKKLRALEEIVADSKPTSDLLAAAGPRLQLAVAAAVVQALCLDKSTAHTNGLTILRKNAGFVRYIFQTCALHVAQFETEGKSPSSTEWDALVLIGRTIVHEIGVGKEVSAARRFIGATDKARAKSGKEKKEGKKFGSKAANKDKSPAAEASMLETLTRLTAVASTGGPMAKGALTLWEELTAPLELPEGAAAAVDEAAVAAPAAASSPPDGMPFFAWLIDRFETEIAEDPPRYKEAAAVASILHAVGARVTCPADRARIRGWFERTGQRWPEANELEDQKKQAPVCKALVTHLLGLGTDTVYLETAATLAEDCKLVFHLADADVDTQLDVDFSIVTETGCESGVVPTMILSCVDTALNDVEWFSKKFVGPKAGGARTEMCSVFTQRLTQIMSVLAQLAEVQVRGGEIFKSLKRVYLQLVAATREQIALVAPEDDKIDVTVNGRIMHETANKMTRKVSPLITSIVQAASEAASDHVSKMRKRAKKGDAKARKEDKLGKNAASRVSKHVPALVFSMEQYERYLIQLADKSKVRLLKDVKRADSRDFRIDLLEAQDLVGGAEDDGDSDSDGDSLGHRKRKGGKAAEDGSRSPKRSKADAEYDEGDAEAMGDDETEEMHEEGHGGLFDNEADDDDGME
mmetsp:Transcript_29805/g.89121  ORF Transcript_29805/g.89121 Transcript_29805/m.89121 type:complete len:1366 (+) Transcript_29805:52-4149(+)